MTHSSRRLTTATLLSVAGLLFGAGGCAEGDIDSLDCDRGDLSCEQTTTKDVTSRDAGAAVAAPNTGTGNNTKSGTSTIDAGTSNQSPLQDAGKDTGTPPSDAGNSPPDSGAGPTAGGGIGTKCTSNAQCATNLSCLDVPLLGKTCTKFCGSKNDCSTKRCILVCLP